MWRWWYERRPGEERVSDDSRPLPSAVVVSVRAGRVAAHDRPDWDRVRTHDWRTAFWKEELHGPARIGTLGVEGDEQADQRHHGGPHMALLMYAEAHYEHWRTLE